MHAALATEAPSCGISVADLCTRQSAQQMVPDLKGCLPACHESLPALHLVALRRLSAGLPNMQRLLPSASAGQDQSPLRVCTTLRMPSHSQDAMLIQVCMPALSPRG